MRTATVLYMYNCVVTVGLLKVTVMKSLTLRGRVHCGCRSLMIVIDRGYIVLSDQSGTSYARPACV